LYSKKEEKPGALDKTNMDLSLKPGEDFFRYANGNWLKNHPIPDEYTSYSAFTELSERNEAQLKEIIKEASENQEAQAGSIPQKIRDFYNAGMDSATINTKGYTEILPYLTKIDTMQNKEELAEIIGFLHKYGFGSLFADGSGSDPKQADMIIYHVYQGGLTLPDRDDYLTNDSAKIEMRQKYVEHMTNMFKLIGIEEIAAKAKADSVLAFETRLAEKSLSRVERRNPERTCNKMDLASLKAITPIFNWDNYLVSIEAPAIDSLNVGMPEYMAGLNQNIESTPLESIKDYLRWKVITNSAPYMGDEFVQEDFNFFNSYLYGQVVMQPRWRRVLDMTSGCLGEAIGQLYVKNISLRQQKKE
jgi:Predicted metalloendopeptidase